MTGPDSVAELCHFYTLFNNYSCNSDIDPTRHDKTRYLGP
jgi:hypothetical protein